MEKNFEFCIGIIMSVLCFLFGKIDTPIITVLCFIVVDYITGMAKAITKTKVSSKTAFKGFIKKLMIILILGFGVRLDLLINADGMIRNFVIYYYIGVEGISILENCVSLNIPIPDKLVNILEQIQKEDKK